MGMAHMLGLAGTPPELTALGLREPMLHPGERTLFGCDPRAMTEWERSEIGRLGITSIPADRICEAAADAAHAVLDRLPRDVTLLVHFDVDVVDFVDLPLAENYSQNRGVSFAAATDALRVLLGDPRFGGLSIGEVNPDRGDPDGSTVARLVDGLADALEAALPGGPRSPREMKR